MTGPTPRPAAEPAWKANLLDTVQRLAFAHRHVYRQQFQPGAGTGSGREQAQHYGLKTLGYLRAEAEAHARVAGLDPAQIVEARSKGLRGIVPQDRIAHAPRTANAMRELLIGEVANELWVLEHMAVLEAARLQTGTEGLFAADLATVKNYHRNAITLWRRATTIASGLDLSAAEQDGMWATSAEQWRTIAAGTIHPHDAEVLEARWRRYAVSLDQPSVHEIEQARRLMAELGGQEVPIPRWNTMLVQAADAVASTRSTSEHPIGEAIHAALPEGPGREWTPPADPDNRPDPTGSEHRPELDS